jgi:SP family sugar:H+ symporter-like MFS transporter
VSTLDLLVSDSRLTQFSSFSGLFAVDRLGRRSLLFIGSFMMFSGQIIAGGESL